jgi:phosphatidylserine decarboxylase
LTYDIKFSIYDHDRLVKNDVVGSAMVDLTELIATFLNQDKKTVTSLQKEHVLPLKLASSLGDKIRSLAKKKDDQEEEKEPTLTVRVNFQAYEGLRRQLWDRLCERFDHDDNGKINSIELEAILESIGTNIKTETIQKLFEKRHKAHTDEFTREEFVDMMEEATTNGTLKYIFDLKRCPLCQQPIRAQQSQVGVVTHMAICSSSKSGQKIDRFLMGGFLTEDYAQRKFIERVASYVSFGSYAVGKNNANILVQNRKTGLLVEEKMPTYIRLGIRLLYQNPMEAVESKLVRKLLRDMSIRQGLKFNDPASQKEILPFIHYHQIEVNEMDLKPLPGKQDSMEITAELLAHNYENFNEFFYRKLKPGVRNLDALDDPSIMVSPADCRCNVFPTVTDATTIWIKGENFTLASLLKDEQMGKYYEDGSLGIFRLAPQDYHRFHHPVDGVVGKTVFVAGEYFTVNPMAIRAKHLSVYTENVRCITYIDSDQYGKIAYVCIGAMMVGSIVITSKEGERVTRMQEHGYFAFGGSTILLLIPPQPDGKRFRWDKDLLTNSQSQMETLVQVGMRVGEVSDKLQNK